MVTQVGIDLVAVDSVAEALRSPHGDRYLARIYTDAEIADCRIATGVDPERLAARFAAKEAAIKVLQIGDDAVSMRDIEVRRDASGRVSLMLHGRAAELAARAGLVDFSVSLTHEGGFAAAVVVADRSLQASSQ
jgi:holo-[acyl-carrier protein] synthase